MELTKRVNESDAVKRFAYEKIYDLGQTMHFGMPIFPFQRPGYFYALYRRHADAYNPQSEEGSTSASGVLMIMDHSGTHIDAFCHWARHLKLYGDVEVDSKVETSKGFTMLGAETIPPLLVRGVLLDVAGLKGVEHLPEDYLITAEDLESCEKTQGVRVEAGGAALVRTGFGRFWEEEARYMRAPAVSKEGSLWVAERGPKVVGVDNIGWDPDGVRAVTLGVVAPGHSLFLAQRGIYMIENLNLEELASDKCHTFLFVCLPPKLKGATGSPVRPVAVKM